jgi:hypothetical protein
VAVAPLPIADEIGAAEVEPMMLLLMVDGTAARVDEGGNVSMRAVRDDNNDDDDDDGAADGPSRIERDSARAACSSAPLLAIQRVCVGGWVGE